MYNLSFVTFNYCNTLNDIRNIQGGKNSICLFTVLIWSKNELKLRFALSDVIVWKSAWLCNLELMRLVKLTTTPNATKCWPEIMTFLSGCQTLFIFINLNRLNHYHFCVRSRIQFPWVAQHIWEHIKLWEVLF